MNFLSYARPLRTTLLRLLLCSIASLTAHAQLKWDTQVADLSPKAGDPTIDTTFGFVNAGKTVVEIESVESTCGCAVPTLARTSYAPGERGDLLVRFTIGDRRGVNHKLIRVAIKGEAEPVQLKLTVNIPEPARMNTTLLVWERGEPVTAKTISVEALPDQPLQVLSATSTSPIFSAAVVMVRENEAYQINVTPTATDTQGFALIKIETLLMGQKKTLPAYAQIKPQGSVRPKAP